MPRHFTYPTLRELYGHFIPFFQGGGYKNSRAFGQIKSEEVCTEHKFNVMRTEKMMANLGSAQKDVWSRKGITRVAFMILATATMSHIYQQIWMLTISSTLNLKSFKSWIFKIQQSILERTLADSFENFQNTTHKKTSGVKLRNSKTRHDNQC